MPHAIGSRFDERGCVDNAIAQFLVSRIDGNLDVRQLHRQLIIKKAIFVKRQLWLTESNALVKSRSMTSTVWPSSIMRITASSKTGRLETRYRQCRKPCYWGEIDHVSLKKERRAFFNILSTFFIYVGNVFWFNLDMNWAYNDRAPSVGAIADVMELANS